MGKTIVSIGKIQDLSIPDHLPYAGALRQLVKDAMGQPIEMRDIKPVQSGHSIKLTLDANLQDQTESVLGEVGEMWRPKGATAIVMGLPLVVRYRGRRSKPSGAPRSSALRLIDAVYGLVCG